MKPENSDQNTSEHHHNHSKEICPRHRGQTAVYRPCSRDDTKGDNGGPQWPAEESLQRQPPTIQHSCQKCHDVADYCDRCEEHTECTVITSFEKFRYGENSRGKQERNEQPYQKCKCLDITPAVHADTDTVNKRGPDHADKMFAADV